METKSGNPKKKQQQKRSIEFNFVIKTCCKQSQSPNDKSYSVCGNKLSFYTLIFKLLLIHGNHKNDNSLDAYYSTIFQMLYTYTSLFIHKMYSIIHCVLFLTTMIKLRIHFNFNINFIFYYYTHESYGVVRL